MYSGKTVEQARTVPSSYKVQYVVQIGLSQVTFYLHDSQELYRVGGRDKRCSGSLCALTSEGMTVILAGYCTLSRYHGKLFSEYHDSGWYSVSYC